MDGSATSFNPDLDDKVCEPDEPDTGGNGNGKPKSVFVDNPTIDAIRQELRRIAGLTLSPLESAQALKALVTPTFGIQAIKDEYIAIKLKIESEWEADNRASAPLPVPPTEEELAKQQAEESERQKWDEAVSKRASEIAESDDIPAIFNQSLRIHSRYVAGYETAASIQLSHVARLKPTSAGYIVNGGSASGKDKLIKAGAERLPPEVVEKVTTSSEKSLYYKGDISGKYIIGGELKLLNPGEDDPVQQALRQLISENEISREITEKDDSGRMVNRTYVTKGAAVFIATTTAALTALNDEFVNRLSIIQTDESEETTNAVLDEQAAAVERKPSEKEVEDRDIEIAAWQHFYRQLRPLTVVIPYARKIKPKGRSVTMRRLNPLLLDYISLSALLHQHNRQKDENAGTVVARFADYELAFKLLKQNAPRVNDPVDDKAREVYKLLQKEFVDSPFTRAEAQRKLGMSKPKLIRHLAALKDAGCIVESEKVGRAPTYKVDAELPERENPGFVEPTELALILRNESTQFESFTPESNVSGQVEGSSDSTHRLTESAGGEKIVFEEVSL